jgi:methionyl aminopeptidase
MIRLKSAAQIEGIRKSCHLLSDLFREMRPHARPGATPLELDAFAKKFIESHGGRPAFLGYEGYPASLCVSVNRTVIHGIPDRSRLREGDIVGLDCGIDLDGYFSDAAITLPVGKIAPELEKLLRITRECLDRAIAAVASGNRIHDISRAVYSHATAHGFGVVKQYCGHGVGLDIHEDPQIPNYVSGGANPRLAPGMVLAIEPMINLGTGEVKVLSDEWTVVTLDGKPSAHFEHTVAILENGVEVLTSWDPPF